MCMVLNEPLHYLKKEDKSFLDVCMSDCIDA